MAIKKRCIRCLKVLRADGTCQNPKCPKYKAEESSAATATSKDDITK